MIGGDRCQQLVVVLGVFRLVGALYLEQIGVVHDAAAPTVEPGSVSSEGNDGAGQNASARLRSSCSTALDIREILAERRTAIGYAKILRDLTDIHCPNAEKIVPVQDNLNTHAPSSRHEAFEPTD